MNRDAVTAYQAKKYEDARKILKQALDLASTAGLEKHPIKARTHIHFGIVAIVGFKQRDLGIKQFKKAIEIQSRHRPHQGAGHAGADGRVQRGEGRRHARRRRPPPVAATPPEPPPPRRSPRRRRPRPSPTFPRAAWFTSRCRKASRGAPSPSPSPSRTTCSSRR